MAMPDDLTTLICLFHTEAQADGALKDLQDAGIPSDDITVVGRKSSDSLGYSDAPLASLGVPKKDLDHLQQGLKDGGVLVAVSAFGEAQKAVDDIFRNHKANKIDDKRTDGYTNYKKYKPETQEHPVEFESSTATSSVPSGTASATEFSEASFPAGSTATAFESAGTGTDEIDETVLVEDGVLLDPETQTAIPARIVHLYRRVPDDI